MSLRHKILFPLFAVLLIGFSTLGVTSIHSVSTSLEENIVESVEREGRLIFRSVDGMLKNAENNLLHMREEAIVGQFASLDMSRFEQNFIETNSNTSSALHTPILALTAHAFAEDKDKSLVAGMHDYMTKPIDYKVLANKLVQHVRKK